MEVMRIRITSTVHSAFNLLPSNHDLFSSAMDLQPAGHRIPSETLADIIMRLRNDNGDNGMWGKDSLKPLLTCSLVCRHWAQICRPIVFKVIVIRGEAHLNRLLHLLSTPSCVTPSITDFIQEVSIGDSGKQQKPWIHRVSLVQPYISTDAAWDTMYLHDMSYPSIYGHIPRTVPMGHLKCTTIVFTDVRFRRVHDLFRIIRDLPNLDDLACERVSFDDETVPDEDAIHIARETHIKDGVNLRLEDYSGLRMDRRRLFFALCSAFSRRIAPLDRQLWRTFGQVFALFLVTEDDSPMHFRAEPDEVICWNNQLYLELYPLELKVTYDGDEAPETFFRPPHDWDSLETLLLDLHPTHRLQLDFWNETVFKTMLDAVVEGRLLQRLHAAGQVDVAYIDYGARSSYPRNMQEILALPAEHDIDGHHLVLKASQRFEWGELKGEDERQEYLRGLVAAEQAASNTEAEAGASESSAAQGAVGEGGLSDDENAEWSSRDESDEEESNEEGDEEEGDEESKEEGSDDESGQQGSGALLGERPGE